MGMFGGGLVEVWGVLGLFSGPKISCTGSNNFVKFNFWELIDDPVLLNSVL